MFVFGLPPLPRNKLATLPASETLILTVNNRLARQLVADWAGALNAARPVAELPRIMPLASWFAEAANALAFVENADLPTHRLDAFAAQHVWMDVIAECEAEHPLLDVWLAAQLAIDADRQIDEWGLTVPAHQATPEYQRLRAWRDAYRQRLRALDASDANLEMTTVLDALAAGQVRVWPHVVLAGFSDVSPRLQRLMSTLQQRGAQCHALVQGTPTSTQPLRWQAADHDAEWQAAAAWAGEQLRAHPQGRYAIIAASLEADAPLARRLLTRTLRDDDGQSIPFNVAVGRPLADWPAVRAALAWLRVLAAFDDDQCPAPLLGQALLAGHCAGEERDAHAATAHAALDVAWRRRQITTLTHDAWCQALSACPHLAAAWREARGAWQARSSRATLGYTSSVVSGAPAPPSRYWIASRNTRPSSPAATLPPDWTSWVCSKPRAGAGTASGRWA